MISFFPTSVLNEIRNSTFGRIEFWVSSAGFDIVRPFIENHTCEVLLHNQQYYIIVHNDIEDEFDTNLLAELHDITFGKLPGLRIHQTDGLGVSSFALKYHDKKHCEQEYFSEYGYSGLGEYQAEILADYFQALNEKECNISQS